MLVLNKPYTLCLPFLGKKRQSTGKQVKIRNSYYFNNFFRAQKRAEIILIFASVLNRMLSYLLAHGLHGLPRRLDVVSM